MERESGQTTILFTPPFIHLKNHDSTSFVNEQKWEEKRDQFEAARPSCGLKKPQNL